VPPCVCGMEETHVVTIPIYYYCMILWGLLAIAIVPSNVVPHHILVWLPALEITYIYTYTYMKPICDH